MASSLVSRPHPLIGLSVEEITKAASLVEGYFRERTQNPDLSVYFKHITLDEPPKEVLLPYLDAEDEGVPMSNRPFVPRCAQVIYVEHGKTQPIVSVVSLDVGTVVNHLEANKGQHAPLERSDASMKDDVTDADI